MLVTKNDLSLRLRGRMRLMGMYLVLQVFGYKLNKLDK